ncbi:cyclopropane-fatty-acyl-phospholipid synthase [Iodidimonas nitroreducens]|uniref:Cyclopropane-fatty-acyl-phospholipid synthase n=1 Tax=Iodidimonas nitroreducens TaxID=1236968 RepID=A0A5A7N3L9_9PROT|nr:cyclopropane-fatty-acyl-phospholipid synthase family protein [Iodidimonas nitroreducens]GAK34029.1 putative fatty acid methyltransferase [alpha proteobacterium Q-1]GER02872.1 cyclopropane-fatty-acyl-phospholipid synthase [Iodidimonas nitroreducens]
MGLQGLFSHIIQNGRLDLQIGTGPIHPIGHGEGEPIAIHIKDFTTARKIALDPYLKLGEAWMDGGLEIRNGTLYDFLELLTKNLGDQEDTDPALQRTLRLFRRGLRPFSQFNIAARSQKNVAHHYDLSNDFYRLFLDEGLNYSCAYFKDPKDDLETAQINKLAHIAQKLNISPGQKILDIGCGWGSMALYLAKQYKAQVTGITLSTQQAALARKRVRDRGLESRIDIRLCDYRTLDEQFDRIVSIGMFEHVGRPFYASFFKIINKLLCPNGVALIHHIARSDGPGVTNPWLSRYIFPGGYSPALSEVMPSIEKAGLILTDLEILRLHYAKTLRHWRQRFEANRAEISAMQDEKFCRMWEFYLIGSELAFRYGGHVVAQWQLCRDQHSMPLTRNYLYD